MLDLRSAADVICHESTAGAQREGSRSPRQNHTLGISATATCGFLATGAVLQKGSLFGSRDTDLSPQVGGIPAQRQGVPRSQLAQPCTGSHTLRHATAIWVCLHLHTALGTKTMSPSRVGIMEMSLYLSRTRAPTKHSEQQTESS